MIEAIVFDLDGLLVDSEPYWDQARRGMAAQVGKEWDEDDHRAVMGVSTQDWTSYMIRRLELDLSPEVVQDRIVRRLVELYQERVPFLPGAVEAVELAARHYPIALASGSHPMLIDAVKDHPSLRDKFQVVISADQVARGKPAPDVYLETAGRLRANPEHCICLEDSGNGILAGKRAGMKVIAVPDPRFLPDADILAQAHLVLDSLTSLSLSVLRQLESD